jgi:hypothetical protein
MRLSDHLLDAGGLQGAGDRAIHPTVAWIWRS